MKIPFIASYTPNSKFHYIKRVSFATCTNYNTSTVFSGQRLIIDIIIFIIIIIIIIIIVIVVPYLTLVKIPINDKTKYKSHSLQLGLFTVSVPDATICSSKNALHGPVCY